MNKTEHKETSRGEVEKRRRPGEEDEEKELEAAAAGRRAASERGRETHFYRRWFHVTGVMWRWDH